MIRVVLRADVDNVGNKGDVVDVAHGFARNFLLPRGLALSPIVISAKVGPGGRLFGSVTTTEIAEAIAAQTGVTVDRRDLHLSEPIRSVGSHTVPAKLHASVEFPVTVEVVPG
jgi:large subunit ribosomal protein L9